MTINDTYNHLTNFIPQLSNNKLPYESERIPSKEHGMVGRGERDSGVK